MVSPFLIFGLISPSPSSEVSVNWKQLLDSVAKDSYKIFQRESPIKDQLALFFFPAHHQINLYSSRFPHYNFFKLFVLYWGIANYQCCYSFRWTAKGFSHTYIHAPILPQSGNVTVDQVNFKWIRLWERRLLPNQKGMQIIYLQSFPFAQSELLTPEPELDEGLLPFKIRSRTEMQVFYW